MEYYLVLQRSRVVWSLSRGCWEVERSPLIRPVIYTDEARLPLGACHWDTDVSDQAHVTGTQWQRWEDSFTSLNP
jgi:hypothetical protein